VPCREFLSRQLVNPVQNHVEFSGSCGLLTLNHNEPIAVGSYIVVSAILSFEDSGWIAPLKEQLGNRRRELRFHAYMDDHHRVAVSGKELPAIG
jgi:hypothetical protein